MAVAKITNEVKLAIERKTAKTLPDQPTARGYSAETIRNTLYKWLSDSTNSLFAELDRIVDEINAQVDDITEGSTDITYDNSASGLTAATIQAAIDELDTIIDNIISGATNITYNNAVSGLIATTLKAAIDELDGEIDDIKSGTTVVAEATKATNDTNGNAIHTTYEKVANKRTTWNATPSDISYPSEKLTKDTLDLKVDKATTLLGLDLANDIARAEFVAALGNASSALQGLMSPTDKDRLDALYALLGATADADAVVNTINELLAVLANYPEGVDLVTALAGKVDKVTGKGLSTNDYTDADELKVSHLPANFTTFMGDYYTKAQVDTLLDQLTTAYGLTETAITELAHNGTVLLSSLTDYDYITMYLKHSDTHFIFDAKLIDPAMFVNVGDMIQLNAWENGVQHSYGVLTGNASFSTLDRVKFTASDVTDTLIIKGYKKDAVTGLLVEESFTGTNYLDEETNVHDSLVALDTQIKANADSVTDLEDGTTTAKKAEQDADGNVITETYETKSDATTKENATALKLAEHDELIQDTQETLRKALNSDGVATADDDGTGIIAMGKDVAPAPVRVQVEGLLLDSPNKFNLTTGTANGITYTISGNQITLSGTASAETTLILASGLTATNKAYVNQDYRSGTSAGVITLKNGATALNATYGTDYSGVVTLEDTTITLVIANGAVLTNVIYKVNVNVVTVLQTNKQYSPLYSTTFDLMSDAQIKAQMDLWVTDGTLPYALRGADMNVRLRATGKNIGKPFEFNGTFEVANGTVETATDRYVRTPKIGIKRNSDYKISFPITTIASYYSYYLYNNGVFLYANAGVAMAANATISAATIGNANEIVIAIGNASGGSLPLKSSQFQLEQGSTATTYAPYQDSDLYLQPNTIGYSLPNGIKDSIEMRDGKLYFVQRVQRYVLQASDITFLNTSASVNNDLVYYAVNSNMASLNSTEQRHYIIGWGFDATASFDLVANRGKVYYNETFRSIRFIVAKGTYADLTAAQTALAGTVIYYQLATPVTTLIPSSGVLNAFPSGHIYIDRSIIKDIALYGTSASITNTDYPISSLDFIFNVTTNTELAVSGATIAGGGLSFTHSGITAGDIVIFVYGYGQGLRGLTTVTYYDDPMIVAGSGTTAGKVYKIVPTVVDANIVWTKVEI